MVCIFHAASLDRVDDMKSLRPMLGEPQEIDFAKAVAARVPDGMSSVEEVSRQLVEHLSGMFIWGHPRSQSNVIPPPCIPGILGTLSAGDLQSEFVSEEAVGEGVHLQSRKPSA